MYRVNCPALQKRTRLHAEPGNTNNRRTIDQVKAPVILASFLGVEPAGPVAHNWLVQTLDREIRKPAVSSE